MLSLITCKGIASTITLAGMRLLSDTSHGQETTTLTKRSSTRESTACSSSRCSRMSTMPTSTRCAPFPPRPGMGRTRALTPGEQALLRAYAEDLFDRSKSFEAAQSELAHRYHERPRPLLIFRPVAI